MRWLGLKEVLTDNCWSEEKDFCQGSVYASLTLICLYVHTEMGLQVLDVMQRRILLWTGSQDESLHGCISTELLGAKMLS